jgi:hypothetical protein
VEKDFRVCWTLRELFALPGVGTAMTQGRNWSYCA